MMYRVYFCFCCNRYIFIFSLGREREEGAGWGVPSIVIARATLEPFLTPHSHTFIEKSLPSAADTAHRSKTAGYIISTSAWFCGISPSSTYSLFAIILGAFHDGPTDSDLCGRREGEGR
jgi:hypothetical protein